MEHSPSQADSRAAGYNILRLLWNQNIDYSGLKKLALDSVLNQWSSNCAFTPYFFKVNVSVLFP
jgi:hypothetical protein